MQSTIVPLLWLSSILTATFTVAHNDETVGEWGTAHSAQLLSKFPRHILPKVETEYELKGRNYFVDSLNLTIYDTYDGNSSSTSPSRILIAVHDMFGINDHIKQIADLVAASKSNYGSFRVIVPDFFRGGPASDWETGTGTDVRNLISYYESEVGANVTRFGIFGFCWGGFISVRAGQELSQIRGAGLIHPGLVVTEDAETLKSAILLLPASDDVDFDPFEAIVMSQAGIDAVFHRRFTDMQHGFAGATGNWSNSLINARVDQVIDYSIEFFNKHL